MYYAALKSRKRQLNTVSKTTDGDMTSTTIEGLDANSDYFVQISANNGAGSGVFSMPVSVLRPSTYCLFVYFCSVSCN